MSSPTIAFFGATGGCGLSCLQLCLDAGYTCTALVRTPAKLSHLSSPNLTLIPGDVKDLSTVTQALRTPRPADIIVFSVGGAIKFKPNSLRPTFDGPKICQEGMEVVLRSVSENYDEQKRPLIVAVSTTGISDFGRDIPLPMVPLYHWLLSIPHEDKKTMEEMVRKSGGRFTVVRPSLLSNGEALGVEKVREGVEGSNFEIGYMISRKDVGNWIFHRCIKGEGPDLEGKFVGITH